MYKLLLTIMAVVFISGTQQNKPALYLIGDSTVKNGKDKGDNEQWGWGHFIGEYFDTSRISIHNKALGGTSSRSFQTRGLWDSVLAKLQPGDYVLIQFGHNDGGPLDDTARARGSIKGVGDESKEIYNPILKKQEVVHTYGWYIAKLIREAKQKGAIPVVCSLVPRNVWKDGKVARGSQDYGLWARQTAEKEGALFIDLNALVADVYDREGEEKVASTYFGTKDHTHTIEAGARLNAAEVVEGIRSLKTLKLNDYLK
ncbi:rhamnogalacturonan acetylesterase [Chitinophaga tropicalis]|nr:rhamnogalacturonan acetylesterase [Chitinophaga tropicalis]